MVESWISAFLLSIVFIGMGLLLDFEGVGDTGTDFVSNPWVPFCFILFLITSWGKDAGKFKVYLGFRLTPLWQCISELYMCFAGKC